MGRLITLVAQAENGSFWETNGEFLDQWELPVGVWGKEAVDWVTVNLSWLTDAMAVPFEFLLDLIINSLFGNIPWYLFAVAFLALGWMIRGFRVGLTGAIGLVAAALLGEGFWDLMTQTIGMILVAVIVSCAVGIPMGIISARSDTAWNTIRPILDAMQVIPAFVYLIPVVFIWGTRQLPATIATMIFAFPPVVRLTNLGVRQVPADVVEASRAFGASERRVLLDVQIPLARSAIMAGVNQTLLLALSMVVIAAVIAAGGLGQRVLTGIGTTNIPLGVSAGFALYLVAVALDRISQPSGGTQGGMFRRLMRAMSGEASTEDIPDAEEKESTPTAPKQSTENRSRRMTGGVLATAGGLLTIIAVVFITWASEGSLLSSYVDLEEANLPGQSFVGWQPEGGSFLGIFLGLAGLGALISGIAALSGLSARSNSFLLRAESAWVSSLMAVLLAITYLRIEPAPWSQDYTPGVGPWVALIGALLAVAGAWRLSSERRVVTLDDSQRPYVRTVAAITAAAVLVAVGGLSSWVYDQRRESAFSSQVVQDRIAELRASDLSEAEKAAQIASVMAENTRTEVMVTTGFVDEDPGDETTGLAWWALFAVVAALAAAVVGLFTASSPARARLQWLLDLTMLSMGAGVIAITLSWVFLIMEMGDRLVVAGMGALFTILGGYVITTTAASGLKRVTDDWT